MHARSDSARTQAAGAAAIGGGCEWQGLKATPENPMLRCVNPDCGALIEERHKATMLAGGRWVTELPGVDEETGRARNPSFHASTLYSPLGWKSWFECVDEFRKAKAANDPARMKAWVNTVLGETYYEKGTEVSEHVLAARLEDYPAGHVPDGGAVLVCSVDVHQDRLECQVVSIGSGQEAWLVDFARIYGGPARWSVDELGRASVWERLTAFRRTQYPHLKSGRPMAVACTAIDSAYLGDEVYKYAKAFQGERVFAIRGARTTSRELIQLPTDSNVYKAPMFSLCVDSGKETLMHRLQIRSRRPTSAPSRSISTCRSGLSQNTSSS